MEKNQLKQEEVKEIRNAFNKIRIEMQKIHANLEGIWKECIDLDVGFIDLTIRCSIETSKRDSLEDKILELKKACNRDQQDLDCRYYRLHKDVDELIGEGVQVVAEKDDEDDEAMYQDKERNWTELLEEIELESDVAVLEWYVGVQEKLLEDAK